MSLCEPSKYWCFHLLPLSSLWTFSCHVLLPSSTSPSRTLPLKTLCPVLWPCYFNHVTVTQVMLKPPFTAKKKNPNPTLNHHNTSLPHKTLATETIPPQEVLKLKHQARPTTRRPQSSRSEFQSWRRNPQISTLPW